MSLKMCPDKLNQLIRSTKNLYLLKFFSHIKNEMGGTLKMFKFGTINRFQT